MAVKTRVRARRRPASKSGFTLVELLVVIAIIGMLVGLALPVLNNARAKGRQLECLNNMRNVAQATNSYELQKRQYPGFINVLKLYNGQNYTDRTTGQKHGVSYIIPLLSYLDQPVLEKIWKTPIGAQIGSGTSGSSGGSSGGSTNVTSIVELKLLICPSDPPTMAGANLSYAVNTGMQDSQGSPASSSSQGMPKDWPENGVFFDLYNGNPKLGSSGGGSSGGSSGGGSSGGSSGGGGGSSGGSSGSSTGGQSSGLPQIIMSNDYINRSDGVGQTCMLSENVDSGFYSDYTEARLGLVWSGTGTVDLSQDPPSLKPPNDNMRINTNPGGSELQGGQIQQVQSNSSGGGGGGGGGGSSGGGSSGGGSSGGSSSSSQSTAFARPSAFHSGGVNMAFCDGKVRFVSDSMDYYVYALLMSTNGQRVRQPGSSKVLINFNRQLVESWYIQ